MRLISLKGPGGEVVTQRFAKPIHASSILAQASLYLIYYFSSVLEEIKMTIQNICSGFTLLCLLMFLIR